MGAAGASTTHFHVARHTPKLGGITTTRLCGRAILVQGSNTMGGSGDAGLWPTARVGHPKGFSSLPVGGPRNPSLR